MIPFKFDKIGLPYLEKEGENSLQLLAIYFINIHFYRIMLNKDFMAKHPARKRKDDEPVEEYNDYLTRHYEFKRPLVS